MIKFHFWCSTIMSSISWKHKSSFGVFACFFSIDLNYWSLFVLLLSLFRGIFCPQRVYSILFYVDCKHEIKISCLLVTTFSLHHYIWDCHSVLSLTAFWVLADLCCKVALSCSIDTGVISKPWDRICNGIVYAFDKDNFGPMLFKP